MAAHKSGWAAAFWLALGTLGVGSAHAQNVSPRIVAARIGGVAIYADDVQQTLIRGTAGRPVAPEALPALQAQALAQLVAQVAIDAAIVRDQKAEAGPLEIQQAIQNLEAQLQRQGLTLDAFLKSRDATREELDAQAARQIRWNKILQAAATDERLQATFEKQKADYDGTEVRVAHVLLRLGAGPGLATAEQAVQTAAELRGQILSGKQTFAQAAAQRSAGPSSKNGGDLGFIPRHGVMHEAFAQAAFRLKPGEISPPVVTTAGVHLIQVTEVKPGARPWTEARRELQNRVAQELFEEWAQRELPQAKVEYSGLVPYYLPGTRRLVLPEGKP